ncbi:MAG: hypothetical protein ACRC8Y_08535 [Chroococcales cyanobacterium]
MGEVTLVKSMLNATPCLIGPGGCHRSHFFDAIAVLNDLYLTPVPSPVLGRQQVGGRRRLPQLLQGLL